MEQIEIKSKKGKNKIEYTTCYSLMFTKEKDLPQLLDDEPKAYRVRFDYPFLEWRNFRTPPISTFGELTKELKNYLINVYANELNDEVPAHHQDELYIEQVIVFQRSNVIDIAFGS